MEENNYMTMEKAMNMVKDLEGMVESKDRLIAGRDEELKEIAGYMVDLIYGNPDKHALRIRAIRVLGEQGLVKRVIEKGYELTQDDKAIILDTIEAACLR